MLMKLFRSLFVLLVLFGVFVVVARLLLPLPDISERQDVTATPASADTTFGRTVLAASEAFPALSGVEPIADGTDALASRLSIIDQAEESIEVQYYIWHDDTSGILLLNALDQAAKRGVDVRLLLDDNGVPGLDPFMAALNAQDNFEIRLFNPSTVRNPKTMGFLFDFFRMNRRMHNKSLTVDGAITIIGGRNIGDEYFEIGDEFYKDMDVLAIGSIVPEVATTFYDYWNSNSVFELETIVSGNGDRAGFDARVALVLASEKARAVISDVENSAKKFAESENILEWTTVQLVADDPIKGEGLAKRDDLMIMRLSDILGTIEKRLDLVSAYFVPSTLGTKYFTDLAKQGVDVNILTNAMNTTDVMMVHAGYTKYRRDLLEADVDLFELKLRGGTTPGSEKQLHALGLSGASLHAKTFAVDDKRVFIGSFNFDPRSAILNCEMGFLIDSPTMALDVSQAFDGQFALVSYMPELSADGRMVWKEASATKDPKIWQQEPGTSWFKQVFLVILQTLPIEWML
ncbi:phospholipase D-like domain-containing protein [Planktotalea sp.]|uniref:phospholipase D-like domain-containing protein n=1 Tax=Planktotalea sp. TaxID=2029877 RepID=UPI003D6AC12F